MISISNISLVCPVFTSTNEFMFYPVSVYLSDSRISKKIRILFDETFGG